MTTQHTQHPTPPNNPPPPTTHPQPTTTTHHSPSTTHSSASIPRPPHLFSFFSSHHKSMLFPPPYQYPTHTLPHHHQPTYCPARDQPPTPQNHQPPTPRTHAVLTLSTTHHSKHPVFFQVRAFGGRFAGVAGEEDEVVHGSIWTSRRVEKNGLRPRWRESLVVYLSHPDISLLHFEAQLSLLTTSPSC